MKKNGKNYAAKKKKEDRPLGDFYGTPVSLLWELLLREAIYGKSILDPCSGKSNISNELKKLAGPLQLLVENFDLYYGRSKKDFLKYNIKHDLIITNFPFSEWDEMVLHAKNIAQEIYTIGKMNFWGAHSRNKKGLWKNLKKIHVFYRQVDYRTPYRKDGHFHVGNLVTGWFCWDMNYSGSAIIEPMDVNQYAKLGALKDEKEHN